MIPSQICHRRTRSDCSLDSWSKTWHATCSLCYLRPSLPMSSPLCLIHHCSRHIEASLRQTTAGKLPRRPSLAGYTACTPISSPSTSELLRKEQGIAQTLYPVKLSETWEALQCHGKTSMFQCDFSSLFLLCPCVRLSNLNS